LGCLGSPVCSAAGSQGRFDRIKGLLKLFGHRRPSLNAFLLDDNSAAVKSALSHYVACSEPKAQAQCMSAECNALCSLCIVAPGRAADPIAF
jgi:hypothetical protein